MNPRGVSQNRKEGRGKVPQIKKERKKSPHLGETFRKSGIEGGKRRSERNQDGGLGGKGLVKKSEEKIGGRWKVCVTGIHQVR